MDPVLLTRPRADSERWAQRLARAGVRRVILSPLLDIHPSGQVPEWSGGLLFTSANAVETYQRCGGPSGLPTWCVGPRTAALADEAGLRVQATAPDADRLAQAIPTDVPPLLHLRGAVQRGDLVGALRARGIAASERVIYQAVPQDLTAEALGSFGVGPVVAPLFSPRTASLLVAQCSPDALRNLQAVCLSKAVANALPVPARAIADTPDGVGLFKALVELLGLKGG
ncbi:MAG: uroporphyrinogen-III synthase [Pseudomonadota bacterium]